MSNAPPDIHARDVSSPANNNLATREATTSVYPTNPSNEDEVYASSYDLWGLYGNDNVAQDHDENGNVYWKVTLADGKSLDRIRGWKEFKFEGSDQPVAKEEKKKRTLVSRDEQLYMASPVDPTNEVLVKETRDFIDGKVVDKALINEVKFDGKVILWGGLKLDDAAKAEVESNPGIEGPLTVDAELIHMRAVPRDEPTKIQRLSNKAKVLAGRAGPLFKRAVTWKRQVNAPLDLIMDSAYPGSGKLRRFVYDEKAGEDMWIYVIDNGVAPGVQNDNPGPNKNELTTPPSLDLFIQTPRSEAMGQKKDVDEDNGDPDPKKGNPGSHGTMVAIKAAGKKYGIAKKATIIPTKLTPVLDEIIVAFSLVFDHIKANKRESKSVIVCALGTQEAYTRAGVLGDPALKRILPIFDSIMDLGTPIVFAAGNQRDGSQRDVIDSWPQVLEDAATPIINVGAANRDGSRHEDSQGQDIHAPGEKVSALKKDSTFDVWSGTSPAAPAVAGIIATYIAQGGGPWDNKSGKDRVTEIKKYLMTDASSWVRKEDADKIRVAWNGADQAAHDGAKAACFADARKKKRQAIPDANNLLNSNQTDITPTDGDDQEEEWDPCEPLPTFTLDPEPQPDPIPEPTPEPELPTFTVLRADCKITEAGFGGGRFEVKGAGWGNDDGNALKVAVEPIDNDFTWTQGGGDGIEWTAKFLTLKSAEDVGKAVMDNAKGGLTVSCS